MEKLAVGTPKSPEINIGVHITRIPLSREESGDVFELVVAKKHGKTFYRMHQVEFSGDVNTTSDSTSGYREEQSERRRDYAKDLERLGSLSPKEMEEQKELKDLFVRINRADGRTPVFYNNKEWDAEPPIRESWAQPIKDFFTQLLARAHAK